MDQPRVVQAKDVSEVITKFAATDLMHLYKSTFVPTPSSTTADYLANEVTFTGYAAQSTPGSWLPGLDVNGHGQMIYNGLIQFTQTGIVLTDSAGGFFITDTTSTTLNLVDAFATPIPFNTNGNILLVKPVETLDSGSSNDAELIYGP